jgi:hypothetical protein
MTLSERGGSPVEQPRYKRAEERSASVCHDATASDRGATDVRPPQGCLLLAINAEVQFSKRCLLTFISR